MRSNAQLEAEGLFDDGYPTEAALAVISDWPHTQSYSKLFEFIRELWHYADCGYWKEEHTTDELHGCGVRKYTISTAGWSGNEDLIRAMEENRMLWAMCWVQSRRGGHYIFHVRD